MLIAEHLEGVECLQAQRRPVSSKKDDEAELRSACARWQRSVRRFNQAVTSVGKHDESSQHTISALLLPYEIAELVNEISKIGAVSAEGLKDKASVCAAEFRRHGTEPATHADELILSCIRDAKQFLTTNSAHPTPDLVVEASAACIAAQRQFTASLVALNGPALSLSQEDDCIADATRREQLLRVETFRLCHLSAGKLNCIIAKGAALQSLIAAEQWECLHQRDLAISYCDDLLSYTALQIRNSPLFPRASRMFTALKLR